MRTGRRPSPSGHSTPTPCSRGPARSPTSPTALDGRTGLYAPRHRRYHLLSACWLTRAADIADGSGEQRGKYAEYTYLGPGIVTKLKYPQVGADGLAMTLDPPSSRKAGLRRAGRFGRVADVRWQTEPQPRDGRWAGHYRHSESWLRAEMQAQVLQEDCGVRYNRKRIRDVDFTRSADLFIHGMIESANGGTCACVPCWQMGGIIT